MRRIGCLFAILVFGALLQCGIGVNPLSHTDISFDPSDPNDPNNPNTVPSGTLVSPSSGARGVTLTIEGSGFSSGTSVYVGESVCSSPSVTPPTQLTCTVGPNAPGQQDVRFVNLNGQSTTLPGAFTQSVYLYISNQGSASVSAYSIAASTGALTVISSSFSVTAGPKALIVDPLGKYLFVLGTTKVSVLSIQNTTGILTEISGSPYGIGQGLSQIAVSPKGTYLYLARNDPVDDSLSTYSIDRGTGSLTLVTTTDGFNPLSSLTLVPSGDFLYAGRDASAGIAGYTVNSLTGALTAMPGSPFSFTNTPQFLTVDRTGAWLVAQTTDTPRTFNKYKKIPPGGTLAADSDYSMSDTNFSIQALVFHPTKDFLYAVVGGSSEVVTTMRFDISSGAISELENTTVQTNPKGLALVGNFAFVCNSGANTVSVLTVNADGTLSPSSVWSTGATPVNAAID